MGISFGQPKKSIHQLSDFYQLAKDGLYFAWP
jgi:hypothetical protein